MATVEVRSDRNPDVVYEVDAEAGTCSCPHYMQKLRLVNEQKASEPGYIASIDALTCKHVIHVRQQMEAEGR